MHFEPCDFAKRYIKSSRKVVVIAFVMNGVKSKFHVDKLFVFLRCDSVKLLQLHLGQIPLHKKRIIFVNEF